MAVAAIIRPSVRRPIPGGGGLPPRTQPRRKRHPKMKIVPEGGDPFVVPYAPRESSMDGVVPSWSTVERGGRDPLLLRAGSQLETMSFDLVFGHPDPQDSIEEELKRLRKLAGSGNRFRVKLDATSAARLWRLTGFTQTVVSRQRGTNEPTRALCSLTFTAASDAVVQVGPVSGGAKGGGKGGDGKGGKGKKDEIPKFYVVKKGDTLSAIAKRFYGETSFWRRIADANKIRDPRKLKVGTRLTLPRKHDNGKP